MPGSVVGPPPGAPYGGQYGGAYGGGYGGYGGYGAPGGYAPQGELSFKCNIDGRGFDTEQNRPTNLQIPLVRK